jgi:hypothetical protein
MVYLMELHHRLELAKCAITGYAIVKTSGASYKKFVSCPFYLLQAFEIIARLIPEAFKFVFSIMKVDSEGLSAL